MFNTKKKTALYHFDFEFVYDESKGYPRTLYRTFSNETP